MDLGKERKGITEEWTNIGTRNAWQNCVIEIELKVVSGDSEYYLFQSYLISI
jgi:hypothetical protein